MVTRAMVLLFAAVVLASCAGDTDAGDGHVVSLVGDLNQQWKVQPRGTNMTMAAIDRNRAVMAFGDGALRPFDLESGKQVWESGRA